jgi:hypothetical protein
VCGKSLGALTDEFFCLRRRAEYQDLEFVVALSSKSLVNVRKVCFRCPLCGLIVNRTWARLGQIQIVEAPASGEQSSGGNIQNPKGFLHNIVKRSELRADVVAVNPGTRSTRSPFSFVSLLNRCSKLVGCVDIIFLRWELRNDSLLEISQISRVKLKRSGSKVGENKFRCHTIE